MTMLSIGLPRPEFDVHVCVLTRSGPLQSELQEAGIEPVLIDKSWKVDPGAYARLKRAIERLRPDLVHTWIFAANSYGRHAALAARVPHVLAGERCADRWKSWRELWIDRYLAKRTDWIVVNSTAVRDFYVARKLPSEKFAVIPNGIPPAPPKTGTREQLLSELGLPADARLIGAVGRLWPQKRYKDLIWATDLLKVIRDDTHLIIVGDGPQRDLLRRFRDNVRIQDRVHFLGHREDVPRLIGHLDCFWIGSGYEGQSNALMEAMAAGIPVVASDIPGNRDLVVHGESGYLFPVGDRAGLARWTNLLLDQSAAAKQIGAAAQARMLQEFSVEKMIDRHAELYRRTVG